MATLPSRDTAFLADIISGAGGVETWPTAAAYGNGVSSAEVLAYIQDAVLAGPRCCEKSDGALLSGDDNLFDITGGPIKLIEVTGIVTTLIVGATNGKLTYTTVAPAATVDMSAGAVALDDDAVGTSYQHINTTGILTPVTAGVVKEANAFATLPTTWLLPIGTMKLNSSAARAGVIKWYLRYVPLSPLSRVAAAA
ncbi:MAG: hypothetical protein ACREA9_25640 [Pyrinomonadaceae bacterium]